MATSSETILTNQNMATKKKDKSTSGYLVDVINNGVVVEDMANHNINCESYGDTFCGDRNTPIYQFLGKYLWREIKGASVEDIARFKVTITIEER